MKYLVLFAILAVAYFLWRSQKRRAEAASRPRPAEPARADPALPQDMVRCPVCSVHLPRNEAVADPQGRLYCSPEHRAGASR